MKSFLFLFFLPCLVIADLQCPDSKTTCPEGKECCEEDGQYVCCDHLDVAENIPEGKRKVFAGLETLVSVPFANVSMADVQYGGFDKCSYRNCPTKCCHSYFCCPDMRGICCPDNKCCPAGLRCCPLGCCPSDVECCFGGCCSTGQKCCGTWCCKKKQQCGQYANTCYGAGSNVVPFITTVLLMLLVPFVSKSYFL
ncbi:uncharacterized protein CDAR_469561 [Caerostris darwini]|uniref:Granulin n=1 Tax=Caerostris darwini TaxID=1538125 RepID=A0AAV4QX31_9ARAC|nr:uncharacterized protein CDAR_469561 [Caerostris darwini]